MKNSRGQHLYNQGKSTVYCGITGEKIGRFTIWATMGGATVIRKNSLQYAVSYHDGKYETIARWEFAEAQNKPETAPETEEKEMNQPEPEKVTEITTEPQKAKSSHQVISRDQINAWNRIADEIAGTNLWHRFSLQKEYKDGSRWVYLTHNASIRACYKEQTGERFFVKITKGGLYGESYFWLYWENCSGTESERWLLNDLARDFFGC